METSKKKGVAKAVTCKNKKRAFLFRVVTQQPRENHAKLDKRPRDAFETQEERSLPGKTVLSITSNRLVWC